MKHFNITSVTFLAQAIQSLPQAIQSLPQDIKLCIFIALAISSYISHRCYMENKIYTLESEVALLNKTVGDLKKSVDELNYAFTYMGQITTERDKKIDTMEQCVDFMFTNASHVQKALYKKLEFEVKYREHKKEPNLVQNRQQAIQEYAIAKKTVARRFNEV
jgi:hypothetical protein